MPRATPSLRASAFLLVPVLALVGLGSAMDDAPSSMDPDSAAQAAAMVDQPPSAIRPAPAPADDSERTAVRAAAPRTAPADATAEDAPTPTAKDAGTSKGAEGEAAAKDQDAAKARKAAKAKEAKA